MRTTLASRLRQWRALGTPVVGLLAFAVTSNADDRAALLTAIHKLENPRNLTRPGPRGELGAYQFRSSTWRMHTTVPFEQALDRETSDVVAVKHYEWLKRGLLAARMPATDYNIALAWNGGLTAAIKGHAPRAAHNYAQRAVNLASTFARETQPALPVPPTQASATQLSALSFVADAR